MGATLNKKIAGMPVKVWAIVILAAIGLGLYLRHRAQNASAVDSSSGDALPVDSSQPIYGTGGGGTGGGGVGGDTGGSGTDLTPVMDALTKLETDLLTAIGSIPQPSEIPAPAPAPQSPPQQGSSPPPNQGGNPSTGPTPPPPTVQTPPPPTPGGPVPGASFVWVFAAINGLPAHSIWHIEDKGLFLQHLAARGMSYAQWKANHASAALRVFGDS